MNSYGLYLTDENNTLILDGTKIFQSWCNTYADNIETYGTQGATITVPIYIPSQVNTKDNIKYFMLSLRWEGYRVHNAFVAEANLSMNSTGRHTHTNAFATSCGSGGTVSAGSQQNIGSGGPSPSWSVPSHSHNATYRRTTLSDHTHTLGVGNVVGGLTDGKHAHIITDHTHPLEQKIQDYRTDLTTKNFNFNITINNHLFNNYTKLYNNNYSNNIILTYQDIQNYLNILNNIIHITITTSNIAVRLHLLYYLQCYAEV